MCIAIITTAHPQYPFILLNNRDEYLHRPTAPAQWWAEPHSHVLGGYDLHRPVHGTWLGITRQGRIAVLTNFREEGAAAVIQDERSRGAIPIAWLKTPPDADESPADFAQRLVAEHATTHVGGFSLLYGRLQDVIKKQHADESSPHEANGDAAHRGLAVISNRTPDVQGLIWLGSTPGETHALSNSHYGDRSWPKIVQGESSTREAIDASTAAAETKDELLARLFGVLSKDTMPRQRNGEEWEVYLRQLRNSIFIPGIGHDAEMKSKPADAVAAATGLETVNATSGIYGTQKQTVVLVDREGNVTYVERTLYDGEGKPVEKGKGDRRFDFRIEGW
ncbi:NRDE protein-domain-containing protein [Macrophomina phaseolina]|uniref:NRDE protein-domain-containing protein n=1 Tax=Macrophomina phaseolina TaxID=35725 RepID=A0ABQ8G5R2_9PEZI|nr:NRDE protein-domain-containing protein [Macrophomina phaseolina]